MQDIADAEAERFRAPAVELERIIRSGSLWLAAGVVAPGVVLGPLLAAGWRPAHLPPLAAVVFWVGAAVAAAGLGLLMWAGCPVLRSDVEQAHRRKVDTIRLGIPLDVAGMAIALLALLLSPA